MRWRRAAGNTLMKANDILNYLYAALVAMIVLAGEWGLNLLMENDLPPYFLAYPAVFVVAMLWGTGAAILVGLLTGLIGSYLFFPYYHNIILTGPRELAILLMFLAMAMAIAIVVPSFLQKRRLEEQRKMDRRLVATLESIGDAFLACDSAWGLVYINAQAERLLSVRRQEVIGRNCWEVFRLPQGSRLEEEYRRAAGGETRDFEYFFAPLGRWFRNRCFPAAGGGISVYFIDVTAQKQAETQLVALHAKLLAALESMSDAVLIYEPEGNYIEFNEALATFLRFSGKEQCPRSFEEFDALFEVLEMDGQPVSMDRWAVPRAPRGEACTNVEQQLRRKDTGERWTGSFNFAPIRDEQGGTSGVVATARDITGQRRMADELKKAKEAAEAANQAKSRFLAVLSHDLRTPLNAIIGFSELVLMDERAALLDLAQKENIQRISGAGRHILHIIEGLLNLSAIEAGKIILHKERMNAGEFLRGLRKTYEMLASERGIRIESELRTSSIIEVDHHRLWDVMNNLVSNAIKYTPSGGAVTIGAYDGKGTVVVFVRDTGVGISKEDLERIFLPFERAKHQPMSGECQKSVGLGLAICRQLVELHGGSLWVESTVGRGSCFFFQLAAVATGGELGRSSHRDASRHPPAMDV